MSRVHRSTVACDLHGWTLSIDDVSMPFVALERIVGYGLTVFGHPCCGRGLGRFRVPRGAAQRLLRWSDATVGRHTIPVVTVAIAPSTAARLEPELADLLAATPHGSDAPLAVVLGRQTPTPELLRSWTAEELLLWLAHAHPTDVKHAAVELRLGPRYETVVAWQVFTEDSWSEHFTEIEAWAWIHLGADTVGQAIELVNAGFAEPWDWWAARHLERDDSSGEEA